MPTLAGNYKTLREKHGWAEIYTKVDKIGKLHLSRKASTDIYYRGDLEDLWD